MARDYSNIVSGYTLTSPYGRRVRPIPKASEDHAGVDLAAPAGTTIRTPYDGRVIDLGTDSSHGNWIAIQHTLPDGSVVITQYLHMRDAPTLEIGNPVVQGQEIGKVGNTGNSKGPHLHYDGCSRRNTDYLIEKSSKSWLFDSYM